MHANTITECCRFALYFIKNNLDFYMSLDGDEFFLYKNGKHEHKVLVRLEYSICKDYTYYCTCFHCSQ